MSINTQHKVLFIITGVGWLFILLVFLFPTDTFDQSFLFLMPPSVALLTCISVAVYLSSRQKNKEILAGQNTFKKAVSYFGIVLLSLFTAVVAYIALLIVAMSKSSQPLSTYGTPIYRPKIK